MMTVCSTTLSQLWENICFFLYQNSYIFLPSSVVSPPLLTVETFRPATCCGCFLCSCFILFTKVKFKYLNITGTLLWLPSTLRNETAFVSKHRLDLLNECRWTRFLTTCCFKCESDWLIFDWMHVCNRLLAYSDFYSPGAKCSWTFRRAPRKTIFLTPGFKKISFSHVLDPCGQL